MLMRSEKLILQIGVGYFEQRKPFSVVSVAKVVIMNVKYGRIRKNTAMLRSSGTKANVRNMAGDFTAE
jgi:ribosomal protein L23